MNNSPFMCPDILENISMYLIDVHAERHFSFGTWTSRQHIFIGLFAKGKQGWGENIISVNQPQIQLDEWGAILQKLKGKPLGTALLLVRENMGVWRDRLTEILEMALLDLIGKLEKVSALSYLGLQVKAPIYGASVILADNLKIVEKSIKQITENNRASIVKVKLFGNEVLDSEIIKIVRSYTKRESTFLLGDVNCGLSKQEFEVPLSSIAETLNRFSLLGLDACEDPAKLTMEGWVALQKMCPDLPLIPDYPLRPARQASKIIKPGMGAYYNIHPGSAASLFDAVQLGLHIKNFGGGLMIGDDSLIGPGCTAWQQIAIGLQASWVEAVEKEGDSDGYGSVVRALTTSNVNNLISMHTATEGFGIELDLSKLENIASKTVHI